MRTNASKTSKSSISAHLSIYFFKGGSKENTIPNRAEALVNHRILPGQTIEEVLQYDRKLVKDIPNVSVDIYKVG